MHETGKQIVEHGVSGYIVESEDEAVAAVQRAAGHDRLRCRLAFEERFTAERMARDYAEVYTAIMRDRMSPLSVARQG